MTQQFFISVTILALLFCSLNAFSGQRMPSVEFPPPYPPRIVINTPYPLMPALYAGFYSQQPNGFYAQQPSEFYAQQLSGFYVQQPSGFYRQQQGEIMEIHLTHNPFMTRFTLNNGAIISQLNPSQAQVNQQTNTFGLQNLYSLLMLKKLEESLARLAINETPSMEQPSIDKNSSDIGRKHSHAFQFSKIDIRSTDTNHKPAAVFIASDRQGNTIAFAGPRNPTGLKLAEILKEHCTSFPEFDINEDTFKRISSNRITPTQVQDLSDARKIIDLDDLMLEIHKEYPDSYHELFP